MTPEEIVKFWIDDVGPSGWYKSEEKLDTEIRDQFLKVWQEARDGAHGLWLMSPLGALGYLILTDQFPRNMFRGSGDSFATDPNALAVAYDAIEKGWDFEIPTPQRQFFYMPMMHSEKLEDQDAGVKFLAERMLDDEGNNAQHAKAHRLIIQRFGRFPYRNEALGRESTQAELDWMKNEGYSAALKEVE